VSTSNLNIVSKFLFACLYEEFLNELQDILVLIATNLSLKYFTKILHISAFSDIYNCLNYQEDLCSNANYGLNARHLYPDANCSGLKYPRKNVDFVYVSLSVIIITSCLYASQLS
jgi:hypothetical protein